MPKKTNLVDLVVEEISLVDRPANPGARMVLMKRDGGEATKSEDGKDFPASDFAYVPDRESPSTWKLRLTSTPGGDPDPQIVGAAVAALGEGFRGNKVELPSGDRAAVVARVRAAWKKANPDKSTDEMPPVLKAAVSKVFEKLPMWVQKMLGVLKVSQDEVDDIFKEEVDMEKLEELTKRLEFSDAVAKLSIQISEATDEKALKSVEQEIGKLEPKDDVRVTSLTKALDAAKKRVEKGTSDATFSEFRKNLPNAMQGAFDNMTPEEKKKFMDHYGKAGSEDPVAKALETVSKDNAEMKAKLEKLDNEAEVRKLMDGDLKDLAGVTKVDDLAAAVLKLRKSDSDATEVLVKQIKALVAQVKEAGLFKVQGKDGAGNGASAMAKLETLATEYMAKHSEEKLTKEQAIVKVSEMNPELAAQAMGTPKA